jgi:hypothetical protein
MAKMLGSVQAVLRARDRRVLVELGVALDNTTESTRRKLQNVVLRWEHKAKFAKKRAANPNGLRQLIELSGADEDIRVFIWVDRGTEPHTIAPKNGTVLVYQVGYNAKTASVARTNVGTGVSTGETVITPKPIEHPGTEPRDFSGYYALEAQEQLNNETVLAIARANNKR